MYILNLGLKTCHLIIGSNEQDRALQLSKARWLILRDIGEIIEESSIYQTEPWGKSDQAWFLNQVLVVNTSKNPTELLNSVKELEVELGRLPSIRWGSRIIDIDILLYGEVEISTEQLVIPHRQLSKRRFVLVPLNELCGHMTIPGLDTSVSELLEACEDVLKVNPYESKSHDVSL